jgi:hypothetical protein
VNPVTELTTDADGHLHLALRGEEGAVTVEAWEHEGTVVGMLTVHSPVPHEMRCASEACDVIGRCHPVFGDWKTNFAAADYLMQGERGGIAAATSIAYNWYISHLCLNRALSS